MSSREKILSAVSNNQPSILPMPNIDDKALTAFADTVEIFVKTAQGIGSKIYFIPKLEDAISIVQDNFQQGRRISSVPEFFEIAETNLSQADSHTLEDVEVGIFRANFGVAENSALWVTDEALNHRVSPFICQHLVLIVNKEDILPTMHHAYEKIGDASYGFATFIAGPSKTADIEQSLVLGAHGPRSLSILILGE